MVGGPCGRWWAFRRAVFFVLFLAVFFVFPVLFSFLVFMLAVLQSFPVLGFSGSRRSGSVAARACSALLPSLAPRSVFVGCCAGGVDRLVRSAFPAASVFRASGSSPRALAARSSVFVRSLVRAGGLLVAFPLGGCPAGVSAGRRSFRGCGSGSWGSVALALALGGGALVFVPGGCGSAAPLGPLGGRFAPVGRVVRLGGVSGRWWFAAPLPPPVVGGGGGVQGSLF